MAENSNCESASSCSRSSCEGCPSQSGEKQSLLAAQNPFSNVKHVIGIVSGKGGVGKSFVTASLATGMAKAGYKTAILDADVTGPSIPKMFGAHGPLMGDEHENLLPYETQDGIKIMSVNLALEHEDDPVVWRGPVIAGIIKQFWSETAWGDVDYMFVDMPPGTGDVPLTVFQSLPVTGIVIVTSPQELVNLIVRKAYNMAGLMNIPILGLVENFSFLKCPDCGKEIKLFGESNIDAIAADLATPVLAKLPLNPEYAQYADHGNFYELDNPYMDQAIEALKKLNR